MVRIVQGRYEQSKVRIVREPSALRISCSAPHCLPVSTADAISKDEVGVKRFVWTTVLRRGSVDSKTRRQTTATTNKTRLRNAKCT